MSRVKVPIVVINSSTGLPVNGASVALSYRATGGAAQWWPTETGGTGSLATIATDASGRITAWVDRGAYNATITGTGITSYTESFDAAPATNASVDQAWVDPTVLIPGEVKMFGGALAPVGWLLCDGSLVSRTTFSTLFSVLGTSYGVGDGSTTFNLPDLRGRSPLGAGSGSGLTTRTRGQTGGEENHVITAAELAAHGHVLVPNSLHPGNLGYVPWAAQPMGVAVQPALGAGGYVVPGNLVTDGTTPRGATTVSDNVGNDVAHNTMHPFAVVSFIIKT